MADAEPVVVVDDQPPSASSETATTDSVAETAAEVSDAELAIATRVVEQVAKRRDRGTPRFRQLRTALLPFLEDYRQRFFAGSGDAEGYRQRRRQRIQDHARRQREKALDRNYINTCQLRAERLAALKVLQEHSGSVALPLIPDGAASVGQAPAVLRLEQADTMAATTASAPTEGGGASGSDGERGSPLHYPRSCYICKKRYNILHFFYDQLCSECAELNYRKRLQEADLRGRIAYVTGGRVKIGFQTALKLLRCGAFVIVSTRFPHDAAVRYAAQPDYDVWRDRLHLYGLDLRDLPQLERFLAYFVRRYSRLDIIINNACQTVRRPPAYYRHLLDRELVALDALPAPLRPHLQSHYELAETSNNHSSGAPAAPAAIGGPTVSSTSHDTGIDDVMASANEITSHGVNPPNVEPSLGAARSAVLSQLRLLADDHVHDPALFPAGVLDVNQQQLDLRTINSWLLKLENVSTPELMEVMTINAMAPFIINARLKPLLERSTHRDRYVINVSAMEGKFYRYKTPEHPHTNMAKASLNMMTRTSAEDYAKSGIYMNAVDTGWINDENPLEVARYGRRIADENNFQTPIDEVDAMARVLDPVIVGVRDGQRPYGQFFKDYVTTEW